MLERLKIRPGWIGVATALVVSVGLSLTPASLQDEINRYAFAPIIGLFAMSLMGIYVMSRASTSKLKSATDVIRQARKSTEDRLDELERLKRRDMVTPEEYAAKRQEILKDL